MLAICALCTAAAASAPPSPPGGAKYLLLDDRNIISSTAEFVLGEVTPLPAGPYGWTLDRCSAPILVLGGMLSLVLILPARPWRAPTARARIAESLSSRAGSCTGDEALGRCAHQRGA